MKNRKLLVVLSALLSVAMLLAACGPAATTEAPVVNKTDAPAVSTTEAATAAPAAEPVTITFWHAYNADVEAKFLDEVLIPAFETANPTIKVQSVLVPYDQFRRKLLIALSGGTAPDLARVDILWVPELADQGALAKMDEVVPDFATYKDSFLAGPLSTNYFNGSYYGLPLDTNTRVLVYNKDMFAAAGIEAAPATMDEFLSDCEKIKALGAGKYCFADGGTYAWAVEPWIWSLGGDLTDANYTVATGYVNSAATVGAYNFLKDGVSKGYIHPGITGGGVDAWGGFNKDEIAMILEGPWFPPMFKGQFPDKQYGMALMPAGEGGSISIVGGEDIVMFQQSAQKEAATTFMKYLLSEDVQLQLADKGQMPVLSSAIDSDYIKNHEFYGLFLEQLKTAKARIPSPNWAKIEEKLTNAGTAIIKGEVDAQTSLDELAAFMDPLLVPQQ